MPTTHTRIAMDRLMFPLLSLLGAEFGATRVMLAGGDRDSKVDRWIDCKLVRDEQAAPVCAFASLRMYTVRIRYIRKAGGAPTTAALESLLDQVERLKRTLINNSNSAAGVYWLDGQIGLVNHEPDLTALSETGEYEGVEIEWSCKINESIS